LRIDGSSLSLPIGREERLAEMIWLSILDADLTVAAAKGRHARPRQPWEKTSRQGQGITWNKSRAPWSRRRWG
jgi:hypothetical protein